MRYVVATLLITKNAPFLDVDILQSGRSMLTTEKPAVTIVLWRQ